MNRNKVIGPVSWISAGLAFASLAIGLLLRCESHECRAAIGYFVVALWALMPPIRFWFEWVFLCRDLSDKELEHVKHLHELSRNIWVALVIVLAALYDIKWPGSGP
jgi:hypothetical protein